MKSLQKFTMSAIGLLAGTFVASGVAIDPSNYNYMMTIAPASGMVSGTLSNFPILVRLSAARHRNFNPADCGENGANLRFALEDGTVLAHEIDTWNADGESLVWVNVPSLKGSTLIAAYWGVKDAAAAPTVNPADTWPDFVAVYHLGEGGTTANDSSGNNYTAVLSDGSASSGSSPKVGGCANVSGYFQTSETALATGVKPLTDWSKLTISAWISVDAWNADGNDKENISLANKMSGWDKKTGGFHCRYFANSPTVNLKPLFTLVRNSGPNANPALDNWSTTLDSASAGNWRYLTCTVDGSSGTHYVNGVSKGTHTLTGGIAAPDQTPLKFGVAKVDGFAARMDELRIRNGAASAAWIAADYAQQNSSSFLDYGLVCGASAILPLPSGGAFLDYLAAKSNRTQESPFATGGDIILMISSSEYVHIFTNVASASTLELSQSVTARILCVGGGGPGGRIHGAHGVPGGGGGAGGFVEREDVKLAAGTYSIVVGKGGAPSAYDTPNNSGGDSAVITSGEIDIVRAHGGGGGGSPGSTFLTLGNYDTDARCGRNGASGGGSCAWDYGDYTGIGGNALYGAEGNRGGYAKGGKEGGTNNRGGGGGGAGAAGNDNTGTNAGDGGDGLSSDITGEELWYAGGGAGGFKWESGSDSNSAGGRGCGGSVAININATGNKIEATDAVRGTGGGGYGGTYYNNIPDSRVGNGADGIVIVRVVKPSGGPSGGMVFFVR